MGVKANKHSHIAFSKSTQAALDNPPVREINEHPRKRSIQYQNYIVCKKKLRYCMGAHINQVMAWCFFLPLLVGLAFVTHPLYSNPGVKLYNYLFWSMNICHFFKKNCFIFGADEKKNYCSDTSSIFSKKVTWKMIFTTWS